MYKQHCQHYRRMQVETAPPERLVTMLYDGAIKNLNLAEDALNDKEWELANGWLLKAQAIITELRCALDFNAGEVAGALHQLYVYMHERLVEANMKKDTQPITEVRDMMGSLKEAWEQAIEKSAAPVGVRGGSI